ncbi:MAG: zf-HC2 domain-containing protein [Candidatus Gastranaerophilales bacterium]|nr:zf-HC2 domain-containing protein [Candidatus Gastranaerophilales bacterium]
MTVNLTCTQVSALLSFYIDDKLSNQLKQFVEAHLEICPTCNAKLEALRSMIKSLREVHEKLSVVKSGAEEYAQSEQNNDFSINLSAYIDNELSDEENLKVKKYIISNPKARQDLEKMYKLKKIMQNSFDKAKNNSKGDYSKFILRRIDMHEEIYGPDSFAKVVALFIIILTVFTITAVIIFWV